MPQPITGPARPVRAGGVVAPGAEHDGPADRRARSGEREGRVDPVVAAPAAVAPDVSEVARMAGTRQRIGSPVGRARLRAQVDARIGVAVAPTQDLEAVEVALRQPPEVGPDPGRRTPSASA